MYLFYMEMELEELILRIEQNLIEIKIIYE